MMVKNNRAGSNKRAGGGKFPPKNKSAGPNKRAGWELANNHKKCRGAG